jgi:Zn finger protein HypA/HybF involved in hydrogenase expression
MAENIIEYPPGRYDCDACGEAVMLTVSSRELPECPRCGRRKYKDIPEPKVTVKKSALPRKYKAGMYACGACGEPRFKINDEYHGDFVKWGGTAGV